MTNPGYSIGRDAVGLTNRERQVLEGIIAGKTIPQIAEHLTVTRQRAHQVVDSLVKKGIVTRTADQFEVSVKIPRS